jgi:hypothetical protein
VSPFAAVAERIAPSTPAVLHSMSVYPVRPMPPKRDAAEHQITTAGRPLAHARPSLPKMDTNRRRADTNSVARSRIGLAVSTIAAAVFAAGFSLLVGGVHEADLLFLVCLLLAVTGIGITIIELLAGYRGSQQKISLCLSALCVLVIVTYLIAFVSSAN